MDVGLYIKQLRTQKGLSQEELGKIIGVQRAAVQKWESGVTQNLKRTTIQKLASYFNVSPIMFVDSKPTDDDTLTKQPIKAPVLGYVAAGVPIDAVEDILDYEELDPERFNPNYQYFGLKIKGDSMTPRIQDGDVVIVRHQPDVESGDVAIICINGNEATCKQLKKHSDGITLISYNNAYEPMFFTKHEVIEKPITVLGKVVELRGKF